MRSWTLLPWILFEASCVFFDHVDGGGGAQGGTQSSSGDAASTGGVAGSGGSGPSAGGSGGGNTCFTPASPAPVLLRNCTAGSHLDETGEKRMCVLARVPSQSPSGPIPGAIALTDRAVFFAAADNACVLGNQKTRIYQFDKNETPSDDFMVAHPAQCMADNPGAGTMTAIRIGLKDHVFFAGQGQPAIQRCTFGVAVENCKSFRMSPDQIQANGPAVIPSCHPELMWALPSAVSESVFFSAPIEEDLEAPPAPRFEVNPPVQGGQGGRFVKVFGSRVALGVYNSVDGYGSVYVMQTADALPSSPQIASFRYQAFSVLTGLALNSTYTYLRSPGSVVRDANKEDIPGDGPIAADDQLVVVAQCTGPNSCQLAKSNDLTLANVNDFGPVFEKVGDIITDDKAFYFTAVLAGDGVNNLVSLVRYEK